MTGSVVTSRRARRELLLVGGAALVSMLLSPITVIWAVVLGVPVAVVAWIVSRSGSSRARTVALVATGVVVGTLPYFALAGLLTLG